MGCSFLDTKVAADLLGHHCTAGIVLAMLCYQCRAHIQNALWITVNSQIGTSVEHLRLTHLLGLTRGLLWGQVRLGRVHAQALVPL